MIVSVRVALVGLGDIGVGAHLPALLRYREARPHVLVDTDRERLRQAERYLAALEDAPDVVLTDDLDRALAGEVQAVVVATPPWITPELTIRCLGADLFVLAEKPVATSVGHAEVYRGLTGAQRARLQIGLTYRHHPAIERLTAWVRDGLLGDPLLVRAHIYDEPLTAGDPAHAERIRATLGHGSPVVHEGAHVFDWLSTILGARPEKVADAWALRTDPASPRANLAGARLSYPGGTVVLVEFGWLTAALPPGRLGFLGPRGHAELDTTDFRLVLETDSKRQVVEPPGERVPLCFDRQLDRFIELVTGRRHAPSPDLSDGIAALETAEQIATRLDEPLLEGTA